MTDIDRRSRLPQFVTSHGPLRALKYRNFAIYAPFSFIASIGFWIQRISIQWLVWTLTGSYAWLGGIVLAEAAAIVAVTPFAGVLVDQMDRRTLARLSRGVLSIVAFAISACVYWDVITIPLLIGFVMLAGAADGFWTPTRLAIVPNLVPRGSITAAISFEATSFHATQFIGPAIAGVIIATVGVDIAFFINGFVFSSVIIALFFIDVRRSDPGNNQNAFFQPIAEAFTYLRRQKGMLALLLFATFTAFFLRPYREFYAGFADEIFNRGAEGLATLATVSGLGALAATVVVGGHGKTAGLARGLFFSASASIVAMCLFALSTTFFVANVGALALGFSLTALGISAQILLQTSVDDAMRGRVMSLWGLQLRAIPSIGGFFIGTAASYANIRVALIAASALFVLAGIVFVWPHRARIRSTEG